MLKAKVTSFWEKVIIGVGVLVFIGMSIFTFNKLGHNDQAASAISTSQQEVDDSTIATVNGEPLSSLEFKQILLKNRSQILSYFQTEYGVTYEKPEFWTTSYKGEVPIEVLKRKALDELIRIKLQQILARDKGLVKDIKYSTFLKEFNRENEHRALAKKKNEVIHGPIEYTEEVYYQYLFSNLVTKLLENLKKKELAFSDIELKEQYEVTKNTIALKPDYVKIQKIVITYVDQDGRVDQAKKKESKAIMEQAKARLAQGENFELLAEQLNETDEAKKNHGEQIFDSLTAREDQRYNPLLNSAVRELEIGEISEVLEISDSYYLIKCIDKQLGGYKSFDEVKDIIQLSYVKKKYDELIDNLVISSNIQIYQDIYDSFQID